MATPAKQENPKHHVMIFRFGGMRQAYNFQDAVIAHGVAASAAYNQGWFVKTDTRCLAHAAELTRFIYGGDRKAGR